MATRSSRAHRAAFAAAFVAALSFDGGDALAYCRTSSCPDVGTSQVCTPDGGADCGIPLAWKSGCVGFSLQKDASAKVPFATIESAMKQAFDTWMNATCPGGGKPRILVSEGSSVECAAHEYNQEGGNANIVLFHDDEWPYDGSTNTLALTTVSYDIETGEIYDADMELNSAQTNFTTSETQVEFDLLSIVTHETGHFLGLAHSATTDATMFAAYVQHDLGLRTLSDDDRAGICTIYPPGAALSSTCDSTPRHGFSGVCGGAIEGTGCCTVAPGSHTGDAGSATVLGVLGVIGALARRGRRATRGREGARR